MVKFTARIPTVEYGYIEVEADNFAEFTEAMISAEDHVKNSPATTEGAIQNLQDQGVVPQGHTGAPQGLPQVSAPPSWAGAPQQFQAPAQQWNQQPAAPAQSPVPFCNHGQRVRRNGNSAKGSWTADFCPQPKGSPDQCKPIFH